MKKSDYPFDTGRTMDVLETRRQIGFHTVAAISGGRVTIIGPSAIDLPVGSGYRVRIILEANDTYTVQRIYRRKIDTVKGEVRDVYADELHDVAYAASCFRDGPFGQ